MDKSNDDAKQDDADGSPQESAALNKLNHPPGKVGQNQRACARRIATTKTDIPGIAREHVDV